MTIKLLDDQLINKIAAGEVIERPASVVKELVENAIDAGSSKITVLIATGGIDRIEVTDDGLGIAGDDVSLALQRHATSKITAEADLFRIDTMGFRGEALPSIASVSRLELYTQFASQTGTRAQLEGGKSLDIEPYPTAPGTKLIVRDLFFNTPARKKFLKSPVSEGIRVHDIMCRLALSRPDISFSFSNEKKLYFKTPGNGNLRDTMVSIYGQDYAHNFLDLEWSGEDYAVRGLVSKPEFRRMNRKNQIFFVNNRLVKSPMLARAVDEGYRGLLLAREFPAVLLFLTIEKGEVDVNVHPQKNEVRFRDEKIVFRLINQAIKDRLTDSPYSGSTRMEWGTTSSRLSNPAASGSSQPIHHETSRIFEPGMPFDFSNQTVERPAWKGLDMEERPLADHEFAVIGQCFNSYILVEKGEELWVVDQHAAHERIRYSRLLEQRESQAAHSQLLTFPLAFDLSTAGMDVLEERHEIWRELGFDIESIGPNSAIIRSAPPELQGKEIEFINECLELLQNEQPINLHREIYAMMACKQAVKAGESLTRAEMAMLIKDLLQVNDYRNCPHGRPTIIQISHLELDKRFKRK
ncbi:MAG: DNA mismatch repair endonuclease MutL [Syntrophomonas sp.]|nr:DNA mismatch repair endonuclease MutL [Syntrophomonas sp.]